MPKPTSKAAQGSTPLRAVAYCRVSSQVQRDRETIDSQLRTLPAFIASRGWTLARPADTYVDDGRTAKAGHLDKRDGFQRLIADAARGLFDVVAVVAMDRLTRAEDMLEKAAVLGPLQRAGVRIAEAGTGQVHQLDDALGEFVAYLATFAAAKENEERRERTIRGRIEAAKRGRKPAGPTLYGYRFDRAQGWSIDEEAAVIVREMYRRTIGGESCYRIALDMERRGIPRPRAGRWHRDRVWQILVNPAYRGEYTCDKGRGLVVQIPPIVPAEDWAAAQETMKHRRTCSTPRSKRWNLCEGITVCSLCGARIYITGNRDRRRYYVCDRRIRPDDGGRCTLPYWRVESLDARVWGLVRETLERPDLLEEAAHTRRRKPDRDWPKELARCDRKLDQMTRAEAQILDRFASGQVSKGALDMYLRKAAGDRERVTADRDLARQNVEAAERTAAEVDTLRAAVAAIRQRMASATPRERQELVRLLVPGRDGYRVELTPDGPRVRGVLRAAGVACSNPTGQDYQFRAGR